MLDGRCVFPPPRPGGGSNEKGKEFKEVSNKDNRRQWLVGSSGPGLPFVCPAGTENRGGSGRRPGTSRSDRAVVLGSTAPTTSSHDLAWRKGAPRPAEPAVP